jgi:hypothetical protein
MTAWCITGIMISFVIGYVSAAIYIEREANLYYRERDAYRPKEPSDNKKTK